MKSFCLRATLLSFIVLGCLVAPVQASSKPATPPPPPDTRKVIQGVTPADSTIVILNHRDQDSVHRYKIDDLTKITINGVPATFSGIRVGMEVTDVLERDSDDLDAITLTGSGEEPKAKKQKKKKN